MKYIVYIFIFLFFNFGIAQVLIENKKFEIKVKKAHKNGKFEVSTSRYNIFPDKYSKKIQIRVNIKTLSENKEIIDPNKFYFLVDNNKSRYRVTDIKYPSAFVSIAFKRLSKEPSDNDKYGTAYGNFYHNDSIKDTFKDYFVDGYRDVDIRLNFGTVKRPKVKTVYYEPNKLKKSRLDIYFIIPKNIYSGTFFYGNTKIKEVTVK